MLRDVCHFQWMWAVFIGLAVGCGQKTPDWLVPPPIDVRAILGAIMEQADKDQSDSLEGEELSVIPALRTALPVLDSNTDKKLSRDEIRTWLERLKKDGVPRQQVSLSIHFRGKPLANASVKLVPEACMKGTIEHAVGTTDDQGLVYMNVHTGGFVGAHCGLYRLEVTGKQANGKPIPAKYGPGSALGYAIGGGLPDSWHPKVVLE